MTTSTAGKALTVSIDSQARFPLIEADEGRVRQVVRNLINHMVRLAPEGGKIELRLRRDGDRVMGEVSGNGPALSPEDQAHIFEAYRRPRDERRRLGGLGIGLAVARMLVELHGGEMGISAAAGKGNTFHFTLPVRRPQHLDDGGKMLLSPEIVPAN
jgi:signal transduction histidine kinase